MLSGCTKLVDKVKNLKAFDIVVHGGGIIGCATALGLAQLGFRVGLIESQISSYHPTPEQFDIRVSAINFSAEKVLERLGIWRLIMQGRTRPYSMLEAFEDESNRLSFDAKQIGMPYLGHFVENGFLQHTLWHSCVEHEAIVCFTPATISSLVMHEQYADIKLDSGELLQAALVVGADGRTSRVRQLAHIGVTGWDYKQAALIMNVKTENTSQTTTWQQFSATGPKAYLPLAGQHGSLVWYHDVERVRQLQFMPKAQLKKTVQAHFPGKLADFEIQQVAHFPIQRQHAQSYYHQRVVLVGDAAHSIHPLAGQGLNLGFKDIEKLLDGIMQAGIHSQDPFSSQVLQKYQTQRYYDNAFMMSAMDFFHRGFQTQFALVKPIRRLALMAAQHSGPLKNKVMRYAMGF